MKVQKIRGQKRKSKEIDVWIKNNLMYHTKYLQQYQYDYCEILVHPWCDISIRNSLIPEPRGENRKKIIAGLLDIYESWKIELDALGEPYYLKIWLYSPHLSKSQVVCAIGDKIDFYDECFEKSVSPKAFAFQNYGALAARLSLYKWMRFEHEMVLENDYLAQPENYRNLKDYLDEKKWLSRKLKRPHRTFQLIEKEIERTFYAFPQGTIWVGGK